MIRYVRKKTGQQIEVKVTPEMQSIIDSFSADVRHSSYVFPIIRDAGKSARLQYETALRMQNHRLKKLAAIAGTSRTLSTHWARHTWASIGKQNNLPVRVISECLGHTSEKTTRIYLDLLDNKLLDAANETVLSAIPEAAPKDGAGAEDIAVPVFNGCRFTPPRDEFIRNKGLPGGGKAFIGFVCKN